MKELKHFVVGALVLVTFPVWGLLLAAASIVTAVALSVSRIGETALDAIRMWRRT